MPATRYERWDVRNSILARRQRTYRDFLTNGTTKPSDDTTGVLPGVSRTTLAGNQTITVDNTVIQNRDITGRVDIRAANVSILNCTMYNLVCTDSQCENAFIQDCTIRPPGAGNNTYGAGVVGHDFYLNRCKISGFIDGFNIHNTNLAPADYPLNVTCHHFWIDGLAYWTAASAGVVHTSDTWTHNDGFQVFGGFGLEIVGGWIDAKLERQYAHWQSTTYPTEPYSPITLNSLGDGGPWHELPDRGTGTEASGRYNSDSATPVKAISLTGLLINNSQGRTREIVMTDNWIYGGDFGVNLGGFNYDSTGVSLGTFHRNRFDRSQGSQGAGGNDTHTFSGAGTGWSGFINSGAGTSNRNYYEDQGNTPAGEINFRGD